MLFSAPTLFYALLGKGGKRLSVIEGARVRMCMCVCVRKGREKGVF